MPFSFVSQQTPGFGPHFPWCTMVFPWGKERRSDIVAIGSPAHRREWGHEPYGLQLWGGIAMALPNFRFLGLVATFPLHAKEYLKCSTQNRCSFGGKKPQKLYLKTFFPVQSSFSKRVFWFFWPTLSIVHGQASLYMVWGREIIKNVHATKSTLPRYKMRGNREIP